MDNPEQRPFWASVFEEGFMPYPFLRGEAYDLIEDTANKLSDYFREKLELVNQKKARWMLRRFFKGMYWRGYQAGFSDARAEALDIIASMKEEARTAD